MGTNLLDNLGRRESPCIAEPMRALRHPVADEAREALRRAGLADGTPFVLSAGFGDGPGLVWRQAHHCACAAAIRRASHRQMTGECRVVAEPTMHEVALSAEQRASASRRPCSKHPGLQGEPRQGPSGDAIPGHDEIEGEGWITVCPRPWERQNRERRGQPCD